MKLLLTCALLFIAVVSLTSATEELQCYQCSPVTYECEDSKADIVKCGAVSMSKCSRQVRKDSLDKSKALRKCVITDTSGNVNCPVGYECYNCDKNLCNADPVVTTPAPSSGNFVKDVWSAVIAIFCAIIYL